MSIRLYPALRTSAALTLLGALYLACIGLARSSLMQVQPTALSVGLLLDLTVTAGAICYLLLVRPGTLPRVALIPLFLFGLFTASRILPEEQQGLFAALGVVWAVAELAIAGTVLVRDRRLVRTTRAACRRGEAPWPAFAAGLADVIGHARIAEVIAQEAIAAYYALTGWLRRPRAADGVTVFSHHRSHAWGAVVLATVREGIRSARELEAATGIQLRFSAIQRHLAEAFGGPGGTAEQVPILAMERHIVAPFAPRPQGARRHSSVV